MQQCPGLTARYSAYLVEGREVSPRRQAGEGHARQSNGWAGRRRDALDTQDPTPAASALDGHGDGQRQRRGGPSDQCIQPARSRVVAEILLVAGDARPPRCSATTTGPRAAYECSADPSLRVLGRRCRRPGKVARVRGRRQRRSSGSLQRLLAAAGRDIDVVLGIDSGT